MIKIIQSEDRHHVDFGWLDARWHFSFGDYYDPANENFSALRVYNDDIVHGGGGFPTHPHRNMEIITYIIDGELAHKDSMGNQESIKPDEVQVMSAGSGVRHSEFNHSSEKSVRLNQIWIEPRKLNQKPRWEQKAFDINGQRGKFVPLVSNGSIPGTLTIDQDAVIEVGKISAGSRVIKNVPNGRSLYVFVIAGKASVNGQKLSAGDQARIVKEEKLEFAFESDSHLLLIELP